MWQARSKSLPNQGGVDIQFKGMTSAFVQTVKINGVTGLWRGLTANLLKVDIFMYIFNLFGFAWCMRIIKLFGLRIMPTKHDVSAKERSNIISINHTSNLNILLVSELC